jgi:hypothetical protein
MFELLDLDLSEDDGVSTRVELISEWMCDNYGIAEHEINNGYCFIWAFLAYGAIKGSKLYSDYEGDSIDHAFIEFRNLVYDCEHIQGVEIEDAEGLALFGEVLPIDLKDFCKVWTEFGLRRHQFVELLRQMKKAEIQTRRRTIRNLGLDFLK